MSVENAIPKGWVETTLADVVSKLGDGLHGTPKYSEDGEYYFINGNNLTEGKIEIKKETKRCSKEEYEKYRKNLNSRTILVSINGSLGYFAYYNNEKCFLGKSACYFNVKDSISKRFIGYQIRTNYFQKYIQRLAGGTTIKNVSLKTMREFPFIIPKDIEKQKAIANVLTAFDDKIELLQQQNKTLETIAQTIFKEWFGKYQLGDELPEGWRVGKLEEILEIKYGKDHIHLKDGIYPLYGSGGIMRYVEKSLYDEESILIPRKGTLTNLFYLNQPFWSVDTMFYSKIKYSFQGRFVFLFLKSIDLSSMNVGSAVPSLTTQVLNQIPIIIPKDEVVIEFNNIVLSFYNKIEINNSQIQSLTKTRDTLLPKLMSGKVLVKM